jgi:transposase
MLTKENFVEIHVLHRQGHGIKAIARQLGISKNTVKKHLKQPMVLPCYTPRPDRATKLCPYKPYIMGRIEAAKPHWIPATVLLRELQEQGYEGGLTRLRSFIFPFKYDKSDPVVRFETLPGVQMQVDFTTIRKGRHPLKAFVATLGYSRASYVHFFDNERNESWMNGIIEAFHYFGGVPRECLFDNTKTIIIERDAYGEGKHRWHSKLLELSKDYGFSARVCRPYRAKTKGKVERFNGYLKGSFITPLAASLKQSGLTLDVATANAHIGRWLHDIAHQRCHGTTGEKPQILLDKEQHDLLPLPANMTRIMSAHTSEPSAVIPLERIQHPLSIYDQLMGIPL